MINFSKHIASFNTPFGVILPLKFYSIMLASWLQSIFIHVRNYCSRLTVPSFANLSIRQKTFIIDEGEGFAKGAPLDKFNSLFEFRFCSIFTHKYNLVIDKSNIQYSNDIYNLSVENDNTYVTKIGIVHNCRCTTISHDDIATTDIKGMEFENVPDEFKMNAGKDRLVFSPKHPYFTVDRGYKELAKKNYNLPLP